MGQMIKLEKGKGAKKQWCLAQPEQVPRLLEVGWKPAPSKKEK